MFVRFWQVNAGFGRFVEYAYLASVSQDLITILMGVIKRFVQIWSLRLRTWGVRGKKCYHLGLRGVMKALTKLLVHNTCITECLSRSLSLHMIPSQF